MTKKKLEFKPAEAAKAGGAHRREEHLGGRQITLDEAIRVASKKGTTGRKRSFPEKTRLNVFIPPELVRRIKTHAAADGKTISEFVAAWAETLKA